MWKLIQKIFKKSKKDKLDDINILNFPRSDKNFSQAIPIDHITNNELRFTCEKTLTDFETLVEQLHSYSGYIRENKLRQVNETFIPELFPHILDRLSDYVAINRELAKSHILKWSKEENFSALCINNFLLITSLDIRERVDKDFLQVFFNAISGDVLGIEKVLMFHQGKLSKVLLDYVIRYEWIGRERLFAICKFSKYSIVRDYWLDEILEIESDDVLLRELKQSRYKDVQYRILDVLYCKDILTNEYLIELWESKFYSITDYAYFILRCKKFDFNLYFQNVPIENLSQKQARTRAFQWLLVKGSVEVFFEILSKISSKETVNLLIFKAIKQKYISLDVFLDFVEKSQQKLEFWYLLKLKKYTDVKFNVNLIEKYFDFIDTRIPLISKLHIVDGINPWDELYWFVVQYYYVDTNKDKEYFDWYVRTKLYYLHFAIYPPHWSLEQQGKFRKLFPIFYKEYKDILSHENIQHILKEYI